MRRPNKMAISRTIQRFEETESNKDPSRLLVVIDYRRKGVQKASSERGIREACIGKGVERNHTGHFGRDRRQLAEAPEEMP